VKNPVEYGVVITDTEGAIKSFLEKPSWGEVFSDQVNTGIYILEPEVLDWIPPGKPFDFSRDLFPRLLQEGKLLLGVSLPGYWCDVGNLDQYYQAQMDVLQGKVNIRWPGEEMGSGIWAEEGVEVHPSAVLEGPLLLGAYCRVGPGAQVGPYAVLGAHTRVERGGTVRRSFLWDNVRVGSNSISEGVGVASGVRTGSRVRLGEGVVVGEGTCMEREVQVYPGVKVWPYKHLGACTVLRESLVWGKGSFRPLFVGSQAPFSSGLDLTPLQVARLGWAYGSAFPPGSPLGVSRLPGGRGDGLPSSGFWPDGCGDQGYRSGGFAYTGLPFCRGLSGFEGCLPYQGRYSKK